MPYNPPAYDALMGSTERLDTYFAVSNKHYSCDYKRLVESIAGLEKSYEQKAGRDATEIRKNQARTIIRLSESLENNIKVTKKKHQKMILIGALLFRYMRITDEYRNTGTKFFGWMGVNKQGAWDTNFGQCLIACLNLNSSLRSDTRILNQIDAYTQVTCLKALKEYLFESPGVLKKGLNIFDERPEVYYEFLVSKISNLEPSINKYERVFERIHFVQSLAKTFSFLLLQTDLLATEMKSKLPLTDEKAVESFINELVEAKKLSPIFSVSHPPGFTYPISSEKELILYINELKNDMQKILSRALVGAYLVIREQNITGASNSTLDPMVTQVLWDTIDKNIGLTKANSFDDKESKWTAYHFIDQLLKNYLPKEELDKIEFKCTTNLDTLLVKIKDLSPTVEEVSEERRQKESSIVNSH
jgi:hypothetical protein